MSVNNLSIEMNVEHLPFNCTKSLKNRAVNVLKNEGINKIKDLSYLNTSKLWALPNCGKKTVQAIIEVLDMVVAEEFSVRSKIVKDNIYLKNNMTVKSLLNRVSLIEDVDIWTLNRISNLWKEDENKLKKLLGVVKKEREEENGRSK